MQRQQKVWEGWAQEDPMWAILSHPSKLNGKWEPEEFFETGIRDINLLMERLKERGITVGRGRALDFGCGLGRLTQALAGHFDHVDGVDVAPSMIDGARRFNQYGARVQYYVNSTDDLRQFESNAYDLIYSVIVLQHNPPEINEGYVKDFIRMLAPGGYAVFQAAGRYLPPPDIRLPKGSHQAWIELDQSVPALIAGEPAQLFVKIVNTSPFAWNAHAKLFVRNHWLASDGTELVHDDGRGSVDDAVGPEESLYVRVDVTCPNVPGRYILELDAVEEMVCWFADHGSPTLRLPVTVQPRPQGPAEVDELADETKSAPSPYSTYPWLPEQVLATITAAGGRAEVMYDPLNSSGPEWESYWYFATKP